MASPMEVLSVLNTLLLCVFGFFCFSAGLNLLAELAEENIGTTKRIFKYIILVCGGLNVILLVTSSALFYSSLVGLAANCLYLTLLPKYPMLELMSVNCILAFIFLCAHNVVVFAHFAVRWYPLDQVVAYMVLCVWGPPFWVFISCSANELALPSTSVAGNHMNADRKAPRGSLLGFFKYLQDKLGLGSSQKTL
eukprot:m.342893 g.342893  ORF g.342893 m.342893 type:complete len:194 (+) comp21995_c0_seq1:489-1070(+)